MTVNDQMVSEFKENGIWNCVNIFTLIGMATMLAGVILYVIGFWGIGGVVLYALIGPLPIITIRNREYRLKTTAVNLTDEGVILSFRKRPALLVPYSEIRSLSMQRPTTIGLKEERHLYAKGRFFPFMITRRQALAIRQEYERVIGYPLP